jgi:hypothetical protein
MDIFIEPLHTKRQQQRYRAGTRADAQRSDGLAERRITTGGECYQLREELSPAIREYAQTRTERLSYDCVMRVAYAGALLLLTTSCAHGKPDTPASEPPSVAVQPVAAQPAATPAAAPPNVATQPAAPQPPIAPVSEPSSVAMQPVAPQPEATPVSEPPSVAMQPVAPSPAAKPPAPATPQPAPAPAARIPAPPTASKAAPPVAQTPAAAPAAQALDLNALEAQLRDTKAIGFFTKITLKNQVDDLLDKFGEYHQGKAKLTMTDLRRSYDLLMMKVLSLLQDADQKLASAIVSSREAIWNLLVDPKKFATLRG